MIKKFKLILALCLLTPTVSLMLAAKANADESKSYSSAKRDFTLEKVVGNLDSPWSIAFISKDDWLVTEHGGKLRRVKEGKLQEQAISGLPEIQNKGQGGLLDVALHPNFAQNKWVYLSYMQREKGLYGTEVLRGQLEDNALTNVEVLFKALPKKKGGRHFGSRLAFDNNNHLFISLGDRGSKQTSQQLNNHLGSIIRLNDDGSIPASNPFVNVNDAMPEIYSYGHRNVQGMVFDPASNTLWAHEHGPQGGDELNKVLAGQNYGWPTITYGVNYGIGTKIGEGTEKEGMLQPITFWDPSIAPSGMAIVNSTQFPEWAGNVLVGALKFELIARLELAQTDNGASQVVSEERLIASEIGRIRDVRQGPDGLIYVLTHSSNGAVYRIR